MNSNNLHIFAYAAQGIGISGSDRIFAEIARNVPTEINVHIYVSDEGRKMCTRMNLASKNISYHISNISHWRKLGYLVFYLRLVILGVWKGLVVTLPNDGDIVYSASEFWMDFIPALLIKIRNKKVRWVASWYQTAPSPLKEFGSRDRVFSPYYWLIQKASKPFISAFSDIVCVNNLSEKSVFLNKAKENKIFIMYGAVPLKEIKNWKLKIGNPKKSYDAVFQGRLHPQKGVVELIDIWKKVVGKRPNAKLAMIGDGPLMRNVKLQISNYKLENNVTLFGFLFDGYEKYKIFSQSKIVVHPSTFDSGGMAAAEGMAFGLPVVGFNLASYRDYYEKGMIKVPVLDKEDFAEAILKLLENKKYYLKMSSEAEKEVKKWSWKKRAGEFWRFINEEKQS